MKSSQVQPLPRAEELQIPAIPLSYILSKLDALFTSVQRNTLEKPEGKRIDKHLKDLGFLCLVLLDFLKLAPHLKSFPSFGNGSKPPHTCIKGEILAY